LSAKSAPQTFWIVVRLDFPQGFSRPAQPGGDPEPLGFVGVGFSFQKLLQVSHMTGPELAFNRLALDEPLSVPIALQEVLSAK
jgi:hypothetical protein